MSILTGESKCRGMYTDEHQLDVRTFHTDPYSQQQQENDEMKRRRHLQSVSIQRQSSSGSGSGSGSTRSSTRSSLCDALTILSLQDNLDKAGFHPFQSPYIQCHIVQQSPTTNNDTNTKNNTNVTYSIVKIEPSQSPMKALESLVLVVPFAQDWFQSDFHTSVLIFLERMVTSPWLAKNILLLSPNAQSMTLQETVSGYFEHVTCMSLPMTFTDTLIRQLVVLDMEIDNESNHHKHNNYNYNYNRRRDEYVLLTHGSRGIVPNLDLVSAARFSLQQNLGRQVSIVMHPFDLKWWEEWVRKNLSSSWLWWLDQEWRDWAVDLGHMVAFMAAFWR